MSKDRTPEVGDIWEEKPLKIKYTIMAKGDGGVYVLALYHSGDKDVGFIHKSDYKNINYLGKSKANIDDLFKTENEE